MVKPTNSRPYTRYLSITVTVGNNYQTNIQMTQNPKIYRIDKKNRMLENSLNCLLTIEK